MSDSKRGRLVVVSGPSGVGKGTVLKHVLERDDFVYSVSATTSQATNIEIFYGHEDKKWEKLHKVDDIFHYHLLFAYERHFCPECMGQRA